MAKLAATFLVAFGAITALSAFTQPAVAIEYPWCAQYGGLGDGGRNCGFSTYAQCMATVSGIGGGCERNLFYNGPAERSAGSAHKSRRTPLKQQYARCCVVNDREMRDGYCWPERRCWQQQCCSLAALCRYDRISVCAHGYRW